MGMDKVIEKKKGIQKKQIVWEVGYWETPKGLNINDPQCNCIAVRLYSVSDCIPDYCDYLD